MNYLITVLFLIIWIVSIFGYGLLVPAFLKHLKIQFNFEQPYSSTIIGLSGFIFIYFLSSIINFFLPLNKYVALIILIFGIIILILNRKKVVLLFKKDDIVLIISLLIFTCFIPFRWLQYYDTGLYHLQAIKWFSSVKLPIGLANLISRIGFNSSWFTINAIVEQPVLLLKVPFFISNAICIFYYGINIVFSFRELIKKNIKLSNVFCALTIIPWLLNAISSSSSSSAPDSPVIFFTFIIIILIISLFEKIEKNSHLFIFISIFSFFAITLKISSIILVLSIPVILFMNFFSKNRNFINRNEIIAGFLFSLFLIPWIITGIFISGYLIFPINFSRINSLNWAVPGKIARDLQENIEIWAKAPGTNSPIIFTNYHWFKDWITRFTIFNKIVVILIIFCLILQVFYLIKKNINKYSLNDKTAYRLPLIISIIGVVFWFLNAPNMRFGSGYVFSLLLLLIGYNIYSINLINNLHIFFFKIKNNRKYNLIKKIILTAGIILLFLAFIFLFFKKLEHPLLYFIAFIKNKEINASWIIKLKLIFYIFLILGIIITFISFLLLKKKNMFLNSTIALIFIILLNLVITESYFFYFKEFMGYPTANKFTEVPIKIERNVYNHFVYVSIDSDQLWDSPLFSTTEFNKNLRIVNGKSNSRIKFWIEE
ncbi:MAG: hypothetical protein FJW63_00715 [Actinobacteria bacterium]|nr:hypothetical protein [Actinomycetota bacterium]